MQAINNDGKGSVASDVAGGAEGIHCDVEGDDKSLCFRIEPQYASQGTECSHHRSARHTRSRHHADAKNHDEMEEKRQIVRQAADETYGKCATSDLHHRAR